MFHRPRRRPPAPKKSWPPPEPRQPEPDFTQELIDHIDAELEREAWNRLTPDEQIEVAVYVRAIERGPVFNGGETHMIATHGSGTVRTFTAPTAEELMERDREAYRAGRQPGPDPATPFGDMARAMRAEADRAREQYAHLMEEKVALGIALANREAHPNRITAGSMTMGGRGLSMAYKGEWFA